MKNTWVRRSLMLLICLVVVFTVGERALASQITFPTGNIFRGVTYATNIAINMSDDCGVSISAPGLVLTNLSYQYAFFPPDIYYPTAAAANIKFTSTGTKTITLDYAGTTWHNYPCESSGHFTQTVTVNEPVTTVNTLGCPSDIVAGVPFTCSPSYTTDIPADQQTGVQYNWSTSGLTVNANGSLTFASGGSKTLSLTVNFPMADESGTGAQVLNVITPDVQIHSLGCPTGALSNQAFTCTPTVTANLPISFQGGVQYNWSGNGLTVNQDGTMKFTTPGAKTVSLNVNYPAANTSVTSTQNMDIAAPTVTISSLGCPTEVLNNEAFNCNPSFTTNLPSGQQSDMQINWSGDGLTVNQDGSMKFTTPGTKTVSLSVNYPSAGISGTSTQNMGVIAPTVTIASLGCPATALTLHSFSCTPQVTTNLPAIYQGGVQYAWSGDGLTVNQNGTMSFNSAGTKTISVTVTYPAASASGTATQNIGVGSPNAQVASLGCPANVIANVPFTCNPSVTSDLPGNYTEGIIYTWSGNGLQVNEDGSLAFVSSGSKTINLMVSYPLFSGVTGTGAQAMSVSAPTFGITSLGCPTDALTTKSFTCTPTVSTNVPASYKSGIQYAWSGDGLQVLDGGAMIITDAGTKTVSLTVSHPSFAGVTDTKTYNISVVEPEITIVSLGCPTDAITQKTFTCNPQVSSNVPSGYKTGAQYVWTGDGLTINQNGTMFFTTPGAKSISLSLTYPMIGTTGQQTQNVNAITPAATVSSLGCPLEAIINEPFTCTPSYTTNLPDSFQTGVRLTWSGSGLQQGSGNSLMFTSAGASKDITLTVSYPLVDYAASGTAQMFVGSVNVQVSSLGCPAEVKSQALFNCTPSVTTDLPPSWQNKLTYTWSGDTLYVDPDGSMSLSGFGSMPLTLTVGIQGRQVTFQRTEDINIAAASMQISNIGCPANVLVHIPFGCAPDIATDMSDDQKNSLQYAWSGYDLQTVADGKLAFTASNISKRIVLAVTDPSSGLTIKREATMRVDPMIVNIKTIRCPDKIRERKSFTCTPLVDTNLPDSVSAGLKYAWSGADLSILSDGSFSFAASGSKTVSLNITQPDYADINSTKSVAVNVFPAAVKIKSMGCPSSVTEYRAFSCIPRISTDTDTNIDTVTYVWKMDDKVLSTTKNLNAVAPDAGSTTMTLTATLPDPDTGGVLSTDQSVQVTTITANTTPLRLYVEAPKLAETGSQITLTAKTTFETPEIMRYDWTVGGQAYTGQTVTVDVPQNQVAPLSYSVTAQPNCCSAIQAETKAGQINVMTYSFPTISLAGPRAAETNIAPYSAQFRLSVLNKMQTPLSFVWDYGDGTDPATSAAVSAMTHVYQAPGVYTATLTAFDDRGNSSQYTAQVAVNTLPPRQAVITEIMSNKYLRAPVVGYFKYTLTGGLYQDTPLRTAWSVDGVATSERPYMSLNFPAPGTYSIKVDVATKYGNVVSATTPVTVNANIPPTCSITKQALTPRKYQLIASCQDSDGRIMLISWDLGSGVTSNASRAVVEYRDAGVYPISLTATDDSGASVVVNDTIVVN